MVNHRIWNVMEGLKPVAVMVIVQIGFAGINVLYKLAANHAMNLRVLVAFRFLFAAAFISPIAFFLERKSRPKLTWTVLGQAFLCGLFGGSLSQNLYLESLALTSATFASAMANLVPAVTFILAVSFRLERLALKTMSGKAKVVGTLIGIAGAMVLTFVKGTEIKLWSTHFHLLKHGQDDQNHTNNRHAQVLGALLSVASCFSYAAWLIVQAKMTKNYPCYYSSTALMSLMGTLQSVVFALCVERDWAQWKLGWNIRLLTVAYSVSSSYYRCVSTLVQSGTGRVFDTGRKTLLGKMNVLSVVGTILIMIGLYGVLWGKGKEIQKMSKLMPSMSHSDRDEVIEMITVNDKESKSSKANAMVNDSSTSPSGNMAKEDINGSDLHNNNNDAV
ncbi:hypothetical protein Cgig2_008128 [Carnegiea gigantea]|uniref:WAT1-related protein n=1 Tax=Carnegiea gigantea TaxID=171969 RepID=A0A9Q1L0T9_9CARY|nr:hypothetical protein Cgig2_008128 [Carnegiea gigantea]